MKIRVTKIGAARAQLNEAIALFFEERDPISIHTLIGASLEVLNDHFSDPREVWNNGLMFHYHSVFIKEERRSEAYAKVNEARNFFKHADRDLKKGIDSIEFEPNVNEFFIFGAIQCLEAVEKKLGLVEKRSEEINTFIGWFMARYSEYFHPEVQNYVKDLQPSTEISLWNELLHRNKAKGSSITAGK